ncbi:MAG: hypothetical protein FWD09_03675 [Lentimicrobiaceae bacterium]|nr:hypothetical protein [Lentimicrobiaceae bacterium]
MKYLFIVQGEGRGHLTQAISLSQILRRHGHEIVEVLVGKNSNSEIPEFFVDKIGTKVHKFDTPAFALSTSEKKIKIWKTIISNVTLGKLKKYYKSTEFIHERIKKCKPDAVVNFYDMMAGWTNFIYRETTPFINLGHTFLIDHPDYTIHSKNKHEKLLLRINNALCSIGATKILALSFYPMQKYHRGNMIVVPPLMREEVKKLNPINGEFILGYMVRNGYLNEVKQWHRKNQHVELHIFSDKNEIELNPNFVMHGIDDEVFLYYLEKCSGYITTAGFESICEAMYLGKPVLMVPTHLEQEINAADAVLAGAGISSNSYDIGKLLEYIESAPEKSDTFNKWVDSAEEIFLHQLTTI